MSVINFPQTVLPPRNLAPYGFTRSKSAYHGPDPVIVKDQLVELQNFWRVWGSKEFMFRLCWIQKKPKTEKSEDSLLPEELSFWNKNLVPFYMNAIQTDIEKRLGRRNIFLKPRQAGYTTFSTLRRLFIPCILNPGENGLLISRNGKTAGDCFIMLKRCYNHFAEVDPYDKSKNIFAQELKRNLLHVTYSNRRELVFDAIDVAIRCDSAEDTEVGQGYTYAHVVADEVARWEHNPEETLANLKESIPADGTLDLVSTANGHGGYFFEECMRAREEGRAYKEFVYHFHTWNWHEEYTDTEAADEKTLTKDERIFMAAQEQSAKPVTLFQITWRRKKKEELRHEFDEKYPEDDLSCFLLTGGAFFDKEIVRWRYKELLLYKPREKYAKLEIYRKEQPHRNYIIGADVASGLEISSGNLDWSVGHVLDEETGEQVAQYRSQLLPEEFAWDLASLGERYNNALIAVERNNEGGTVIITLTRACSYMNIYKHMDWWKTGWRRSVKASGRQGSVAEGRMREIEGFPTTPKTRPLALNRFRYYLSEHPNKVHSLQLLDECTTFVRDQDKKGIPAASEGCHDDTVMAAAIAHYCRQVRLGYLPPDVMPHREKYSEIPQEFRTE